MIFSKYILEPWLENSSNYLLVSWAGGDSVRFLENWSKLFFWNSEFHDAGRFLENSFKRTPRWQSWFVLDLDEFSRNRSSSGLEISQKELDFPEFQYFLEFADKGFWKNILDVQNNDEAKIYID